MADSCRLVCKRVRCSHSVYFNCSIALTRAPHYFTVTFRPAEKVHSTSCQATNLFLCGWCAGTFFVPLAGHKFVPSQCTRVSVPPVWCAWSFAISMQAKRDSPRGHLHAASRLSQQRSCVQCVRVRSPLCTMCVCHKCAHCLPRAARTARMAPLAATKMVPTVCTVHR